MRRRVVVTGLGCISPLGLDVESTWQAILAGTSGADYIQNYDASDFKVRFAAEVKGFDGASLFGRRERAAWTASHSSHSQLRFRQQSMPI